MLSKEDIEAGEMFRKKLISLFEEKGVVLAERHVALHGWGLPQLSSLSLHESIIDIVINYFNKSYSLTLSKEEPNILRAGLALLYSKGYTKYNYDLPIFQELKNESLENYIRLAIEAWELDLHKDWMKSCGYTCHNGTKDSIFLSRISSTLRKERDSAVLEHRIRSSKREKDDTPHHIFVAYSSIEKIIVGEGTHPLTEYLIESFYDQATAPVRWYKERELSFEERIAKNMRLGYYMGKDNQKVKCWKPGVFGFTNDYEIYLWKIWCKVHKKFKEYWQNKFGVNEEFWQPPCSSSDLEDLREKS